MLAEGRLVYVTLNANTLNGKPGYADYAVIITAQDGDDYVLHSPGTDEVEPVEDQRISKTTILEAMGGNQNISEVTGVMLGARPIRVDVILAKMYPQFSRAALAKLFDKGLVKTGEKTLKAGDKQLSTKPIEADISSLQEVTETIDLPILYEDEDCVVINKPAGVLTHMRGAFSPEATVASFLRDKLREDMKGERAGIAHRLDRATSGIIIAAKSQEATAWLQKQFANRSVQKTYIAIVPGKLKQPEAIIDMPIERNPKAPATFRVGANGKPAITRYKVLEANEKYSLVELKPQTGRTHQLRVHMAHLGHPIVGDVLYSKTAVYGDRMYLHAQNLSLTLPNGELQTFTAPLPPEFMELMHG
jgi:23S rRNA pseudouridine1911/1915/1917 synthase